jgi:multiple sugar transport system ATP-binding protein
MANVSLNALSKSYDDTPVLAGIDLEIANGEYLVLVGPSGCGKSTLLRCIAGLETISAGELSIGGKRMNDVAPQDRNIAMVFQSYALYPHMTVRRNLGFPLEIRKQSAADIASAVDSVAEILELDKLMDRFPGQLSGGQRQRVAMGRAMVRQPAVFLFDEPLSNLDASLRGHMRAELKRLHRRLGSTFVHVTHDQVEALTLADRIMVLNEGIVQQIGTPRELFDTPANTFVAQFIGSPTMNLLQRDDHTLGVRPSDIHLGQGDLTATVELVESLGAEALVHLDQMGTSMLAQVPEPVAIETGSTVQLRFGRTHRFDRTTGLRLPDSGAQ